MSFYIKAKGENCMINELGGYDFNVYWKTELTASVTISPDHKTIKYFRYTDELPKIPFLNSSPTLEQVYDFLESRCMDRHREQIKEYLEDLGLKEYNPYEIVKITHGAMWEDFMWLKFPDETITWEEVNLREQL